MESKDKNKGDAPFFVGVLLILFGFMLALFGGLPGINLPYAGFGVFMCIVGILLVIVGLAMGVTSEWYEGYERTPRFRTHVNTSTVTKEKEIIVKEVVMIPCNYCGGLMPQTAIYCPHCGAKRKG